MVNDGDIPIKKARSADSYLLIKRNSEITYIVEAGQAKNRT
jgi:hypothetical protein